MGQIDIELIEPVGEPSTWKDRLDQHGESLHHVAFQIKGMSERIAYLDGTGIPPSSAANRYAYVDGSTQLGAILEQLEND